MRFITQTFNGDLHQATDFVNNLNAVEDVFTMQNYGDVTVIIYRVPESRYHLTKSAVHKMEEALTPVGLQQKNPTLYI